MPLALIYVPGNLFEKLRENSKLDCWFKHSNAQRDRLTFVNESRLNFNWKFVVLCLTLFHNHLMYHPYVLLSYFEFCKLRLCNLIPYSFLCNVVSSAWCFVTNDALTQPLPNKSACFSCLLDQTIVVTLGTIFTFNKHIRIILALGE